MGVTNESGAPVARILTAASQIVDSALFTIVNTTTTTTISAGTQNITVASATNIVPGMALTIGGTETVVVNSVSGTTVNATFVNAHSGTTTVVCVVQRQAVIPGSGSIAGNTAEFDAFGNAYAALRSGLSRALITLAGMLGVVPVDGSGYQFATPTTPGVPLCVTAGGAFTGVVTAGAGTTVVFGYPCIITGLLITTAGTTGNNIMYDSESAGSGTKVALACGTTSDSTMMLGRYVPLQIPCANGIVAVGATLSPGFTVCYMPINNIIPN